MTDVNRIIAGLELAKIGWVVAGGTQHLAFRLPVNDFERVTTELCEQGYDVLSAVDHPIARMMFFDTYDTMGVATEIMGITVQGWGIMEQMK